MKPFTPVDDATASIAVTTDSARAGVKRQPSGAHQLRLYNAGSATIFWAAGDAGVSATAADVPLPAGAIEVVTLPNSASSPTTHIAAIAATGAATLYITTGQGL